MVEDTRVFTWSDLEKDIQKRSADKDPFFRLTGKWKIYFGTQTGYVIYEVDGDWVRNNLSVVFGHGGHGMVHEFIPLDEIWISKKHWEDCGCKKVTEDQTFSEAFRNSTILHEITECELMKRGSQFWVAHQLALEEELKSGILTDPYSDM